MAALAEDEASPLLPATETVAIRVVPTVSRAPIVKWLVQVDKYLTPDSVGIMKLGLLDEIPYAKLEHLSTAMEVYGVLEEHMPQSDQEATLKRFVYALTLLGHRRKGHKSVRSLGEFGLREPQPPFNEREQSKEFQFRQCLVKICVRMSRDEARRLIAYCAHLLLEKNWRNIKSIHEMFIEMHEKRLVTAKDQECLVQALDILGASSSIDAIQEYRKQNSMPFIEVPQTSEQVTLAVHAPSVQSSRTSSFLSNDLDPFSSHGHHSQSPSPALPRPFSPVRAYSRGGSSGGRPTPTTVMEVTEREDSGSDIDDKENPVNKVDGDHNGHSNADEITVQHNEPPRVTADVEGRPGAGELIHTVDPPATNPAGAQNPNPRCKMKWSYCGIVSVLAVVVIVAVLATVLAVFTGLSQMYNSSKTELLMSLDVSTEAHLPITPWVVLTSCHQLFTRNVHINTEQVESGDSPQLVDIYVINSDCNDLRAQNFTIQHNGTQLENITLYLLGGSQIHYNISVSSNQTHLQDSEYGELFILDNLEEVRSFDPQRDRHHVWPLHIGWTNITYSVPKHGYYGVIITGPTHPASYLYESVIDARVVDSSTGYMKCTLKGEEDCLVEMGENLGTDTKCILASVGELEGPHGYIHIPLTFAPWLNILIGSLLSVFAFLFSAIIVIGLVIAICLYWWRYRNYEPIT